jgi:hypothetical protein
MTVHHVETSRTRFGAQTSGIATAASTMKDLEIIGPGNPLGEVAQKTAQNNSQTRRRRDYKSTIRLQKSDSPVKFSAYVKGLASVLNAASTPAAFSAAGAVSHQIVYRALFGGELAPTAGSTVASSSGTPVDEITVATGHGSRFVPGQIIIIERDGLAPWVRRVTAVATDTLTISPPLDSGEAPDSGDVVRNAFNYYLAETDSQTFTVEHAAAEASSPETQMRALGVHGSGAFKLGINEAAEVSFDGMSISHTTPGDLSLSTDPVADDMGEPLVWQPVVWWATSLAAAPTVADISMMTLGVARKWQSVPGAVLEGVGSVHEVAGRGEPLSIDCEGLFDSDAWDDFAAMTERAFVAYTVVGVGSAARVVGFWCPRCEVIESPTVGAMDALMSRKFKLRPLLATDIAGATPALSTAQIRTSNIVWFMG